MKDLIKDKQSQVPKAKGVGQEGNLRHSTRTVSSGFMHHHKAIVLKFYKSQCFTKETLPKIHTPNLNQHFDFTKPMAEKLVEQVQLEISCSKDSML